MQYEDSTELLLCQAFELWEPSSEPQNIKSLENSSELEVELTEWQNVVHALAYDAPPLPMTNSKVRLLQRINHQDINHQDAEIKPIEVSKSSNNQKNFSSLPKAISTWQKQAAIADWQFYAEGITISYLDLDLSAREVFCFVRLIPGAKFPRHRHTAPEELIMLEGDLIINDHIYYPGDYIYSQPGSVHQPKTANGCLAIVRASIDDEIIDDEILV